VSHPLYMHKAI